MDRFPSNFARQLEQSQAIGNRPATENMHTDELDYGRYPRIFIDNIGQQAITYNNYQPSIENMGQLAIQNINTENVQSSLENRGHLAIQNMNTKNAQPNLENRGNLAIQNMNTENVQPSLENRGHLAQLEPGEVPEMTTYGCTLCTTPTYFNNFSSLCHHVSRFHDAFDEGERGRKRGGLKDSREHLKKKYKTGKELIGHGFEYEDIESDDETDSNEDKVENSNNYILCKLGNMDTQSEDTDDDETLDDEAEDIDSESEDCQSESDFASCEEEEKIWDINWSNIFVYDITIYERKTGDMEYHENGDVKIDNEVYDEGKI